MTIEMQRMPTVYEELPDSSEHIYIHICINNWIYILAYAYINMHAYTWGIPLLLYPTIITKQHQQITKFEYIYFEKTLC